MFRECCFVWNHALALQRRYYRLFGKYIPVGKMQKQLAGQNLSSMLLTASSADIRI